MVVMLRGAGLAVEGEGVIKGRILLLTDSSAKWTLQVRTWKRSVL
jgi:hypothetical protein